MNFELKHSFDAPVDQVIAAMCDPAFPAFMKANMKSMEDIEPLDRKDSDTTLEWRMRCKPVPMIKKVGPKEIPPSLFPFIQESKVDKAGKTISFRNVGEHAKVKQHLQSSGTFRFREVGGRTERVISGELKVVGLPFLLKPLALIAEQLIYSNAEKLLQEEAAVFGKFLADRKA